MSDEPVAKPTLAVFDIDGTILPGCSAEQIFVRYLRSHGELGLRDAARFALSLLTALPRGWTSATKANKSYLSGKSIDRIERLARECFREEITHKISPVACRKIKEHRTGGCQIVLLSGTLSPLLECFRHHLRVDGAWGVTLQVQGDRYTGNIDGIHPYGSGKVQIVHTSYGPGAYDIENSFAYADHSADLDFLQSFGNPFIVNATGRLAAKARRLGIGLIQF
ncbi:HAD family hydrolase [Candidatus Eisenbacteria bacterium]|uniref:HAD family hydrolase n=1 Tax=Eiseniibacteriota bacterium TaxID=2212470 RepID=A0ABV6YIZ2_UNCEI